MTAKACSINGCNKPVKSRGWCNRHYKRWLVHGNPFTVGVSGPPGADPWTEDQVDFVRRSAGVLTTKQVAVKLSRSFDSVARKAYAAKRDVSHGSSFTAKMNALTAPGAINHRKLWTDKDEVTLRDSSLTLFQKAIHLGRTYTAVANRCSMEGYTSRVGKGDPMAGAWWIDNPNADQYTKAAS